MWRKTIPKCAPSECFEAATLEESIHYAVIELDLIKEKQEASTNYTKKQVKLLRKWIKDNLKES